MGVALDAAYALTLGPHYLYHRAVTGKYGPHAPEKLGRLPAHLGPGGRPALWVHGVSVGETLAARPLVGAFAGAHPHWAVRVSTTTATGRQVACEHFGAESVFYYPLDFSWAVRRAFDTVRPAAVVLMELEVWPAFLSEAARRGVPVVVANVRITERSVRRLRAFGPLARRMLGRVAAWAAQDEGGAARLRAAGVDEERIRVVGSLKADGLDFDERPAEADRLRADLGGGRLWVAGSTHPGEEEAVLAAFAELRARFADLRLVLVPRHPERCDAVERRVPADLSVWRRSRGPAPAGAPVVLVDTMGELAALYRAAEVVFVGGTFDAAVGGHSMLEPAALGRPVVYGPEVHNWAGAARTLEQARGAVRLPEADVHVLAGAVAVLLADPHASRAQGARAREAARSLQGATDRTVALLEETISA